MKNLIKKYNISNIFFDRYLQQNALNRYVVEMTKFMWKKEGKFLNPLKKDEYIEQFIKEEIENFYEKNILNIPQIEFSITTKCTLKCKECCALIPKFNNVGHINMRFDNFKKYLDNICMEVNKIRYLVFLGGEPLVNRDLFKMVEYASQKENIDLIRITSNGTMLPNQKLLNAIKQSQKVYFFISDYSSNTSLKSILKFDELKELLHKNDIKFQTMEDMEWCSELGFASCENTDKEMIKKALECHRLKCTHLIDGVIDVCSKAFAGRKLGYINNDDYIDLLNSDNLKSDLIRFYSNFPSACKQCLLSDRKIMPAEQIK